MAPDATIEKIKNREGALGEAEIPGAPAILRDLGALKRQLHQKQPDGERVRAILSLLAAAAIKI